MLSSDVSKDVSNKRKEKISAYLDNDIHRDELMSFSLSAEVGDAEIARRYQLVGDALRGEVSESSFIDVSVAVREALADEPIYKADTAAADTSAVKETVARDVAAKSAGLFGLSSWLKPVSGMAVAASVAVVMVISLSEQGAEGIAPVATNVAPQSADNQGVQIASEKGIKLQSADFNADLNNVTPVNQQVDPRLVNQHLEFATQDALQGRMPLVRAVSYEADQ